MTTVWPFVFGAAAAGAVLCSGAAFLWKPPAGAASTTSPRWKHLDRVPLRTVLIAGAVGAAVWWATGWPVAALLGAAAAVAVPVLVTGDGEQQLIVRLDALAAWVRRVADLLGSGAGGLEQAIIGSARTAPEPLAVEIETLAVRLRTRSLESALRAFADQVGDEAADEVALTLILRARTGGRGLVEILAATATALEREAAARRDVEADRAKPRTDVHVILGITAVLLAGLFAFAREFLAPFDDLLGQVVMAGIGVLLGAACWWMHMLTRTRRPARLLGLESRTPASARRRGPSVVHGGAEQ